MRARQPDETGYARRAGVDIYWEGYGRGPATILMLPTWSVLDLAHGRFQLVDLSRHYRVVTFDPRGNGRSDRPVGTAAYASEEFVEDAVAVLDATATDRAVVIACSLATHWLLRLAAEHPDRVLGAVASGTNLPFGPEDDESDAVPFLEPYQSTEGWAKFNAHYWRDDYEGFLRFFFSQVWTEPHSTALIDASVANGLQTTPETLIDTVGANPMTETEAIELLRRTRSPWLVVHGQGDQLQPHERAVRLADEVGASLVTMAGAGHCSGNRDPVRFNLLIREFVDELLGWRPRRRTWTRAQNRPRSVMIVPGGTGGRTVERDLAVADALRRTRPGLHVGWLAAEPAGSMLRGRGEAVHPASAQLPAAPNGTSDRFGEWRERDEVNFLQFVVLNDVVADEAPDLVIADDAWGIDHHLHENPELKSYAYAWLTDQIAWLPESDADQRRRFLMADANAEMIEQVERYGRIRDRALFWGQSRDLPQGAFGPGLPGIRDWATSRYTFAGRPGLTAARRVAAQLAELL